MTDAVPVLSVRDLHVCYHTAQGPFPVVDGVDLDVMPDEIFGIAGESGCGKSTVVEGILRLVRTPGRIEAGSVRFLSRRGDAARAPDDGGAPLAPNAVDLLALDGEAMRRMRWRSLAYVPQGSMNALNPVLRVREQMIDCMADHGAGDRAACEGRLPELLQAVGLSSSVLAAYPHQLSGGMRQRVIIAASIALHPEVVVADEPTTALDVHAQRLILQTMQKIRRQFGVAMIFVSHDLAVHAELADRLGVMYAGQVVEIAPIATIFAHPGHPYSWGLVHSLPQIGGQRRRLYGIPGLAPSPLHWPTGCRFHPRCPYAFDRCRQSPPPLRPTGDGHSVACHLYDPEESERLQQAEAAMRAGGAGGARLREVAESRGNTDGG